MTHVKVRRKRDGVERVITQKNYAASPRGTYEKLYNCDEHGVATGNLNTAQTVQQNQLLVNRNAGVAAPVAVSGANFIVKPPIPDDDFEKEAWVGYSEEQPKQAEPVSEEKEEVVKKVKNKPGPKPKAISNTDENAAQ